MGIEKINFLSTGLLGQKFEKIESGVVGLGFHQRLVLAT
jgi:hypothetical protein